MERDLEDFAALRDSPSTLCGTLTKWPVAFKKLSRCFESHVSVYVGRRSRLGVEVKLWAKLRVNVGLVHSPERILVAAKALRC